MPKLKVFRTAIGFHDAYVAVTSRKAALGAWGSDKDLFARGAAEEVTDPDLAAEALASPGTVIRRLRGTAAEQLAALPPERPKRAKAPVDEAPLAIRSKRRATKRASADSAPSPLPPPSPPKAKPKLKPTPKPKPSRDALDRADAEVARAKREQADALATLAEREAALARERRTLERKQADAMRRLLRRRDQAEADYEAAVRRWRD